MGIGENEISDSLFPNVPKHVNEHPPLTSRGIRHKNFILWKFNPQPKQEGSCK